jgi:hypothetical protein
MVTIELSRPWSYVAPDKTIDYTAGEHEVFQYIADKAEADGAIAEGKSDEGTAKSRKTSAADQAEE